MCQFAGELTVEKEKQTLGTTAQGMVPGLLQSILLWVSNRYTDFHDQVIVVAIKSDFETGARPFCLSRKNEYYLVIESQHALLFHFRYKR